MLSRRRFMTIAASVGAGTLLPLTRGRAAAGSLVIWRGMTMGAMASIMLVHPDRKAGERLLDRCVAEITRLEDILSLYRSNSALSRFNRDGMLDDPPPELTEVLSAAVDLARNSDGAFDPTVQPLYELYARHFSDPDADPDGPSPECLAGVMKHVDYRAIAIADDAIRLRRDGMAVTLNGIAQGYITDKIAMLLQADGLENMLIDLGEMRAVGRHPDGRPWRAGVADPANMQDVLFTLELPDRDPGLPALATSGGYGTPFDTQGRHHHLLDPGTGQSVSHYASVSVVAPNALIADGLSTALYVVPPRRAASLIRQYAPARAYVVDNGDEAIRRLG